MLVRNLGVCHADDLFYMWDMYGLNAELGLLDTWWSQANKLNSKRLKYSEKRNQANQHLILSEG